MAAPPCLLERMLPSNRISLPHQERERQSLAANGRVSGALFFLVKLEGPVCFVEMKLSSVSLEALSLCLSKMR